jgi:hypothetical protein
MYGTSAAEMDRRLRAYTTLIVSLLFGVAVSSIDFIRSAPAVSLALLAGLALALILSRFALKRSLRGYAQIRLSMDESSIERTRGTSSEQYPLADVAGLRVVRTSRGSIREITARLGNGRRLSVNGVEAFERFEEELRRRVPAGIAIAEAREPIDYDHPLFYVIFGVLVGLAFTTAVRAMATLGEGGVRWTFLGIAGYSFVLGAYVLIARPIAQRYGPRSRLGDIFLGSLGLLAGVVLAARTLIGFGR